MFRIERKITSFAAAANWAAAAAIAAMMILTVMDVVLRFFRHPIPGTYELVGLLGSAAAAFSLSYTSMEKGHIAVEFLVRRFSASAQALVGAVNAAGAALLFAVVCRQSIAYGIDLMRTGEVSLTLRMPVYPFVFGVAAGCGLLVPVLLSECLQALRRYSYSRHD